MTLQGYSREAIIGESQIRIRGCDKFCNSPPDFRKRQVKS